MPKFNVEKLITIDATEAKVRGAIQDFAQWETWSPWLCMEPQAQLTVEGPAATVGHAYEWTGDMVGAGRMELAEIDGNTDKMNLTFLRPFKSTAKVELETTALSETQTRVTWRMQSGLPFFMFFMVNTMKAMIGMDYERGLKLLKEYTETGAVTSRTEVLGIVDVAATDYIGITADTELKGISESMESTMPRVMEQVTGKETQSFTGAIYHKLDIKTQQCRYTAFAPVNKPDATGTIATCRALKLIHTGSYQHLGNAWSTANTWQRHHKLKKNKQVDPFEYYVNDPAQVASKDLKTEVYLPVIA